MASSIFIGWFGTVRFESTASSVIFPVNVQAERFLGADGTAAAPTHSFYGSGDDDNGMYLSGTNELSWSVNGARYMTLNTTALQLSDASAQLLFSTDVSLARVAANRLRLATGDVMNLAPTAFASLPTGAEGDMACVTDSNTATWGATIAGGGANNVLAFFNGTNWTVAGA